MPPKGSVMKHPTVPEKGSRLRKIVLNAGSAAIAYSGGVDSTLLLKVCTDLLGPKVLAVTARSETFPSRELGEARRLARDMGARHVVIESEELKVPGFSQNPTHRCYLCKKELYAKVRSIAKQEGLRWVFDGSNADDSDDYRPGRKAALELGIRSPLEEALLGKEEIRMLSKEMGLPTWEKPAFACLSSRFPYHTEITAAALKQVEKGEDFLRRLGMKTFRLRHHGPVARIELGHEEMEILWTPSIRDAVVHRFKALGYNYVSLDLEGYRTGSMNEVLKR